MTDRMNRDERIAAYLDGEMDDDDAAAFEAEVENDPELARELARFASNDDLLKAAFDPGSAAEDEALLDRMGLSGSDAPLVRTIDRTTLREPANDDVPVLTRRWWMPGGAVAAALALVLVLRPGSPPQQDGAFADAMDRLPSRQEARLADGRTVMPLLSFRVGDGRYCREYIRSGGLDAGHGIACRDTDGWDIEAHVPGAAAHLAAGEQIETATGENTIALDEAYSRLNASDPLSSEDEKQAMTMRWLDNPK